MSFFERLKKSFNPSVIAVVVLFAGVGFVSAAGEAIVADTITANLNLKVVGTTYLGQGGLKLAAQIFTGNGTNDTVSEWTGAAMVVFPSAKPQVFNLGACAGRPERTVTLIVKDSAFLHVVNGTINEGIIPAGGGAKAPLNMRNYADGDIRSATLYCDGTDWMVSGELLRSGGVTACTADTWTCSDWSACSAGGSQTRTCSMTNDCPGVVTPNPATSQSCTPPAPGALTASLNALPISQAYVKGSQAIDLVGLNLKAGDASDVTLTEVDAIGSVNGTPGSGFNADVVSCRLMDGATSLGQVTATAAGVMNFTGLNAVIAAGTTKGLKVNCDTSGSAVVGDADSVKIVAVTAHGTDGNGAAITGLPINVGPTTAVTFTDSGIMTYALAPDDTESEAGLVIAGQSGVVLGKLRLTAANEDLKQTKLRVSLNAASSYADLVDMSLYDGSTLVGGPTPVDTSGNADFGGLNFIVPKNGSKTLTVKATLNTISGGAVSGANLKMFIDLTSPAAGTFEYRGTTTSTIKTTTTNGDLLGRDKILRKTKPTLSLASLPTGTLSNGTQVLSRFTVTADSAQQVSLKTLTFEADLNGSEALAASGADSNVREVGQGSNIAGAATYTSCASFDICIIKVTFTDEQSISAGTSKTYELRALVAGAVNSGDSVSTKLLGDTAIDMGTLGAGGTTVNGATYNFIWSDNSSIPHNDDTPGPSSSDWTNGFLVKVLPSDTQTMTHS